MEVKTEDEAEPAGDREQDIPRTEQQPEQEADQAEPVKVEPERGGHYGRKRPYEESRGYGYYEHREEKRYA